MRATRIQAIGVGIIVLVLAFGIVWFPNWVKSTRHLAYQVTIEPAEPGAYCLTIPTLVDAHGVETSIADSIAASGPAEVTHINTQYGRAISVCASGALVVGVESDDWDARVWGGSLSLINRSSEGHAMVRMQAVDDFLISIELNYDYRYYSEKSNIFGAADGMNGGGIGNFNASALLQSKSDWIEISGEEWWLFYDGIGSAFLHGLVISIIGYPAGLGIIMMGKRRKDVDPNDFLAR